MGETNLLHWSRVRDGGELSGQAEEIDNSEWIHKFSLNPGKFSYFPVNSAMYFTGHLVYFNSAVLFFVC